MNLFADFPPDAKAWVYTSDRLLKDEEAKEIQIQLNFFTDNWTAHNNQLKARGVVYCNALIIIMVDETTAPISGCGIDKSVAFIKNIGKSFQIDFFNRFILVAYQNNKAVIYTPQKLKQSILNNLVNSSTIVFNTLINSKKSFSDNFFITLHNSWASKYLSVSAV